jgi:NDP-sugar pyrophosphorylase family protein
MVLRPLRGSDAFSAIEIDADDRVRRILGQPEPAGEGLRRMMFTGVHVLAARAHRDLPKSGCVIRDAYRQWLERGERVMAIVDESAWRDLGVTVRHYLEGNQAVLRNAWPSITSAEHDNLVDPSAEISPRAVVCRSVIGANASVAPNVRVERAVVWPNARVTSDLIDSVLTTRGARVRA